MIKSYDQLMLEHANRVFDAIFGNPKPAATDLKGATVRCLEGQTNPP